MSSDVDEFEKEKIELNKNSIISSNSDSVDLLPKRSLIAIPCYNEEPTIGSVVLKAKKFSDEVLVVDDGSTDKTAQIAEYAGAIVLRHGGNKGYGAAIQTCFNYAREGDFDILTILDGDGQHDADQIHIVMRPVLENKADISIGSRFIDHSKKNIPLYRRFGIWTLTRFTNAGSREFYHKVKDAQSGFRSYSKNAIQNIRPKDSNMGVSAEILMHGRKKNLSFTEVPINCSYDTNLSCSTKRPIGHGFSVILSILKYMEVQHSLLFFGVPGFIFFIIGLFFGFNVYLTYIEKGYLPFGPSLISIGSIILGLLLSMTGLILHAVINASKRK